MHDAWRGHWWNAVEGCLGMKQEGGVAQGASRGPMLQMWLRDDTPQCTLYL